MLVLLFVALWFILRGDLLYVFPCVILFLCFSVLLVLRLPRLGKRELILVLFVRLFGLCLFRFVGFLFLLGSGKGCGLWLWHSLVFSLTFFATTQWNERWFEKFYFIKCPSRDNQVGLCIRTVWFYVAYVLILYFYKAAMGQDFDSDRRFLCHFDHLWDVKARGSSARFAHLSETAIAYLQMPYNILPVLPQQLGQKFDSAVKRSKVILGSSFEQTWWTLRPQCYISRFSLKAFLVLDKKILSVLPYMGIVVILFQSEKPLKQSVSITSIGSPMWNLVKIGKWFQRKNIWRFIGY